MIAVGARQCTERHSELANVVTSTFGIASPTSRDTEVGSRPPGGCYRTCSGSVLHEGSGQPHLLVGIGGHIACGPPICDYSSLIDCVHRAQVASARHTPRLPPKLACCRRITKPASKTRITLTPDVSFRCSLQSAWHGLPSRRRCIFVALFCADPDAASRPTRRRHPDCRA